MILVIPAFEPSQRLVNTVQDCVTAGFARIVVINDGSGEPFDEVFEQLREFETVTVLTNEVNQGKGYSLKKGFDFVQKTYPDALGVVTADADGQHLPEDILRVVRELRESPEQSEAKLVLGSRNFTGDDVPARSRLGNRSTTALIKFLYGTRITDTQTGLRGIPTQELGALVRVKGSRFEYEMNMLLDLMNRKVPISEIEISTVYHDLQNTQSHFRPVRDSIQVWFQILKFTLSSLTGAGVDILVYSVLVSTVFPEPQTALTLTLAIVIARVVSGVTNYVINRQIVFADGNKVRVSFTRYVSLALLLVMISAAGTVVLSKLFGGHAILAKILVDVGLYVLSFIIQKRWVFTKDRSLEV